MGAKESSLCCQSAGVLDAHGDRVEEVVAPPVRVQKVFSDEVETTDRDGDNGDNNERELSARPSPRPCSSTATPSGQSVGNASIGMSEAVATPRSAVEDKPNERAVFRLLGAVAEAHGDLRNLSPTRERGGRHGSGEEASAGRRADPEKTSAEGDHAASHEEAVALEDKLLGLQDPGAPCDLVHSSHTVADAAVWSESRPVAPVVPRISGLSLSGIQAGGKDSTQVAPLDLEVVAPLSGSLGPRRRSQKTTARGSPHEGRGVDAQAPELSAGAEIN